MLNEHSYKIVYEADMETGQVIATIPELNHVSSFGDNFAEAEANVREAALGYLEVLIKENKEIPISAFQTDGTYLKVNGVSHHLSCVYDLQILTYCLMPNHWHLVLYPKAIAIQSFEDGSLMHMRASDMW